MADQLCKRCKKEPINYKEGTGKVCTRCAEGMELFDIFFGRQAREDAAFKEWSDKAKRLYQRTRTITKLEDELMHKTMGPVINAIGMTVYEKIKPVNMRKRAYKKHLKTLIRGANGDTP